MKIQSPYNPEPNTDLDEILDKNGLINRLVRLMCKFVRLVAETNNKVQELKT